MIITRNWQGKDYIVRSPVPRYGPPLKLAGWYGDQLWLWRGNPQRLIQVNKGSHWMKKASDLKEVKSFTIDRNKWHRGQGHEGSCLLRNDGTMCCAGFYGKALGLSKTALLRKETFADLKTHFVDEELRSRLDDIHLAMRNGELYDFNDQRSISEKERERIVRDQFKDKLGVKVNFVGKRP